MKRSIFQVILLACAFSSCTLFQRGTDYISDYIPRDSDVPGWNRDMTPVTVDAAGAGTYNQEYAGYGITSMSWCTYSSFENRERVIKVEVIRFGRVIDAYSFFSSISGFSENGTCPDGEFYSDRTAVIRAGEYIIYANTGSDHMENIADLKNFSSISRSYIGDNFSEESLPAVHAVLKRAGASCVLYSKNGIAQAPGISRCYYSMINSDDKKFFLFLSERGSNYDCMSLFQKIIAKKYIILKADNTQSAFIKNDTGTYSFISYYDRWIYGCWNVTDINDGKSILQNIKNAVESYSKTVQ